MSRALRLLLWVLVPVVTFGLFVRPDLIYRAMGPAETLDPCASPLAWHIDSIDPRFGFTGAQVRRAVEEAAAVWEGAAGTRLFRHDTAGSMAIRLVYDQRQQAYEERLDRDADVAARGVEVESRESLLQRLRERVEAARQEHERRETEATASAYRNAIDRYNRAVARYNRAAEDYNAAVEAARDDTLAEITAGNLESSTRTLGGRVVSMDRVLTVAVAGGYDELVLVLTHELGHALGLGHTAAEGALMAERYRQRQVAVPARLTPADRQALADCLGRPLTPDP